MFMIPFGFLEPAESWEPSRVTIVGDAAHGMLPTLGMGANLSLNDAALLIDQLDRVGRGEVDISEALGAYEAQMREIAYPILRMTLQHDETRRRRAEGRGDGCRGPVSGGLDGKNGPGHRDRWRDRSGHGAGVRARGGAHHRL